jgi:hypothetical protein
VETGLTWINNHDGVAGTTDDLHLDYNTITGLGDCWKTDIISDNQAFSNGYLSSGMWMWTSDVTPTNVYFQYNTFSGGDQINSVSGGTTIPSGTWFSGLQTAADTAGVTRDNNTYNMGSNANRGFGYIHSTTTKYEATRTGVAAWKAATGWDANSTFNWSGSGHLFGQ